MRLKSTKVHLLTNQYNLESGEILYHTGVLHGDCLSLILIILSVNPLSFLLNTLNGYRMRKPDSKRTNISHSFFANENLCPKHKRRKTTSRLNNNILKGYKNGVWNRQMFIHQHRKKKYRNNINIEKIT